MEVVERKERKQDKLMKVLLMGLFSQLKAQKPRRELVGLFGEEELTELEIALYAERKNQSGLRSL